MSAITSVETVLASVFAEYVAVSGLTCEASVAVKDVVRSDSFVLKRALADGVANSGAIGICVAKASTTSCSVLFSGHINSLFTGLDDSKDYFLSPSVPGAITEIVPTGAGEIILRIGRPLGATRFILQIGSRLQRAL